MKEFKLTVDYNGSGFIEIYKVVDKGSFSRTVRHLGTFHFENLKQLSDILKEHNIPLAVKK